MKTTLFLLLLLPLSAWSAPGKKNLKLEVTYAPQYFQLNQKNKEEKVSGRGFIYKNLQLNARWKMNVVELDVDFRYSDFNLKSEDSEISAHMRDLSAGITYQNAFLRLENTVSPFLSATPSAQVKSSDLSNNWVTLGYRRIVFPNYRAGGGLSYLLTSDIDGLSVTSHNGHKGNAWIEHWQNLKGLNNVLLSVRLFGEARFIHLKTKEYTGTQDLQSFHLGVHAGIAKTF